MTWQVSVINRNVEYSLSDGTAYWLTGIDGIAMAPIARITERGPLQHGESDLGYRLQPRHIALTLMVRGGSEADWFARRNEIIRIFHGGERPIQLRLSSGDMVRQIDGYLNGTMEMTPEVDLWPNWQRVGIELYCPDPTWYDPTGNAILFRLGGGGLLLIPLEIPMEVGASSIDQNIVIPYEGTWDAYPIITAVGPITNLLIQNNVLGDKLDFNGVTIDASDSYVIDCSYGYKSVTRSSDGANRIQDLTDDSDLATFRIGAPPDVQGGINSIRVRASGLTTASKISIWYQTRYMGV